MLPRRGKRRRASFQRRRVVSSPRLRSCDAPQDAGVLLRVRAAALVFGEHAEVDDVEGGAAAVEARRYGAFEAAGLEFRRRAVRLAAGDGEGFEHATARSDADELIP